MKTALHGLLAFLALGFGLAAHAAPPSVVQVTAQKKKGEAVKSGGRGEGSEAQKKENAAYEITVRNVSMGALPAMTVEYILFVERQKLGEKKTARPLVQRVTGTAKLDPLPRSGAQTVTTEPVELVTESLVGGYHYDAGGRIKAEDSIIGVWVRVMQNGQIAGEMASPSNITGKGWVDKQKAALEGAEKD